MPILFSTLLHFSSSAPPSRARVYNGDRHSSGATGDDGDSDICDNIVCGNFQADMNDDEDNHDKYDDNYDGKAGDNFDL